jgi:hypothetical protein
MSVLMDQALALATKVSALETENHQLRDSNRKLADQLQQLGEENRHLVNQWSQRPAEVPRPLLRGEDAAYVMTTPPGQAVNTLASPIPVLQGDQGMTQDDYKRELSRLRHQFAEPDHGPRGFDQ